ncbi:TIGR03759 family integrating conjugative element protein, partial [Pseudomonas syringae]|uniref:TIGR03759 family integrating conjugative element protein n=1 Tax=Pseudomonas syringae TaxID=317 RepID=UPI0009AEE99F
NSREQQSALLNSQSQSSDEMLARDWHLSPQEWQRYQTLMQSSRGVYSPGLDPLTALGIEARTDEERRRYAELQVKAEAQRTAKELAYQHAYDDAFKRLYPNQMPI